MNSILSLFLCLAMLMTGAYGVDPSQPAARTATISDVTISIGGTEYVLNPSVEMGIATKEGEALLDFGVINGDETYLPVQAKVNGDGVALLVGDTDTVYNLTPDFFRAMLDVENMPAEMKDFVKAYCRLIVAAVELDADDVDSEALNNELMNLAAETMTAEEATLTVDGVEQPAVHVTFELDNDHLAQFMDAAFDELDADFTKAYFDLLNAAMAMSEETKDVTIENFSDFMAAGAMEMSLGMDMTVTEAGAGNAVMTFTTKVEDETIELPIEMNFKEDGTTAMTMTMDMDGMTLSMNITESGDDIEMTVDLSGEGVVMNIAVTAKGETNCDMRMVMSADGVTVDYVVTEEIDANGDIAGKLSMNVNAGEENFGLSMNLTEAASEIVDRIAGSSVIDVNTEDDLSGLTMAAMALSSDVEKLMSESSVAELIGAFAALIPAEEPAA